VLAQDSKVTGCWHELLFPTGSHIVKFGFHGGEDDDDDDDDDILGSGAV
jgi:hypothetical protein